MRGMRWTTLWKLLLLPAVLLLMGDIAPFGGCGCRSRNDGRPPYVPPAPPDAGVTEDAGLPR